MKNEMTAKLIELIKQNPTLPIEFFVDSQVVADEGYNYWLAENNHKRKGIRRRYKKPISAKQVYDLKAHGYSFNKISKLLKLDWGCVKQRYNDYIHDNPEILEVE